MIRSFPTLAAAAILAASGLASGAAMGAQEKGVACSFSAWSTDPDPAGLNVRAGPGVGFPVIARLPPPVVDQDYTFGTEVAVTGAENGWMRIEEAWVVDYLGDDPDEIVFEGVGWVSGRMLAFLINRTPMRAGPSDAAAKVAPLWGELPDRSVWGPDSFRVSRILDCAGDWAEVEGAPYGSDEIQRGWVTGICSNQVTTCP